MKVRGQSSPGPNGLITTASSAPPASTTRLPAISHSIRRRGGYSGYTFSVDRRVERGPASPALSRRVARSTSPDGVRVSVCTAWPDEQAPRRSHLGQFLVCRAGERYRESGAIGSATTAPPVLTTIGCLTTVGLEHETEGVRGQVGHGTTSSTQSWGTVYLMRCISQRFILASS